jgi:hypothetical protein
MWAAVSVYSPLREFLTEWEDENETPILVLDNQNYSPQEQVWRSTAGFDFDNEANGWQGYFPDSINIAECNIDDDCIKILDRSRPPLAAFDAAGDRPMRFDGDDRPGHWVREAVWPHSMFEPNTMFAGNEEYRGGVWREYRTRGDYEPQDLGEGWQRLSFAYDDEQRPVHPVHIYFHPESRTIALPFRIQQIQAGLHFNVEAMFESMLAAMTPTLTDEERTRRRQERQRQRFAAAIDRRDMRAIERAANNLMERQENYRYHLDGLAQAARSVREAEAQVAAHEWAAEHGNTADPDAEWAAILRHDKITEAQISGSNLVLTTPELTLTDPRSGDRVPLGVMQITFGLGGEAASLRIANTTNPQQGRPHPHVGGDGVPCLGNIGETVGNLIGACEFVGAFEQVLQYLESYNPADSWGRHATYWFQAAEADGTLQSGEEAAASDAEANGGGDGEDSDDPTAALRRAARELGIAAPEVQEAPPIDLTDEDRDLTEEEVAALADTADRARRITEQLNRVANTPS